MLKRLGFLLGAQATIFGIIIGYDQLGDEIIQKWLISHAWSINQTIAIYWGIPISLFIVSVGAIRMFSWGSRFVKQRYSQWKLSRVLRLTIQEDEILTAIKRAHNRGLLNRDEATLLLNAIKNLEPIDYEILVLFDSPIKWIQRHDIQPPPSNTLSYLQLLGFIIPLPKGQKEIHRHSVHRLYARQLITIDTGSLNVQKSREKILESVTTTTGHKISYLVNNLRNPKRN